VLRTREAVKSCHIRNTQGAAGCGLCGWMHPTRDAARTWYLTHTQGQGASAGCGLCGLKHATRDAVRTCFHTHLRLGCGICA